MSFDLTLQGFHTFLSTHAGRDQVGKFVNYGTRGAVGVLADLVTRLPKDDPQRKSLEEWRIFLRKIMVSVGDARRTVRWFSGLGIVIALKKLWEKGEAPWDNKLAFAVAQLSLLWWHAWDHYRWCVATQLIQGDQTRIKNVSFTGFVISSFVSSVYFAHKLLTPPPGLLVDKEKAKENQRSLAKSFLTLIATLHISEIYMTHEAICGAAGAVTSAIVIYETFPKIKKQQ
jgi:hypothetical protein